MNYYEYSYQDIPYFSYIRSSWSDTLCIHQIYDLPTYTVLEWEENMSNQLSQCPHCTSEGPCCESLSLDIISPFLLTTVTQQLEDRPPTPNPSEITSVSKLLLLRHGLSVFQTLTEYLCQCDIEE